MKQRMASADVAGEVSCLKERIVGLRLANLYDLNAKTYVLKLAKSGSDGEKVFLLLESGTRFHTVQVMYDKPDAPSNFTLKLRKHLRTRRLEDVRQLGVDRVVDFVFGTGENAHHLILEMYAQGNVILTDHSYQVLTLLRSHRDDDKGRSTMARHPYPMHAIRLRQPLGINTLREALTAASGDAAAAAAGAATTTAAATGSDGAAAAAAATATGDGEESEEAGSDAEDAAEEPAAAAAAAASGKKGKAAAGSSGSSSKKGSSKAGKAAAAGPLLKSVLADLFPYGPAIAEHVCLSAGLQPQHPLASQPLAEPQVEALHAAVQQFEAWLASLDQGAVAQGFISAAPTASSKGKQQQQQGAQGSAGTAAAAAGGGGGGGGGDGVSSDRDGAGRVYLEYNPLRLHQFSRAAELLTFNTFDEALDEYYGKIQGQRVEVAKLDAERAALSRLDRIKSDQGARATALEREAAASELRARLIEYNLEGVDAAIDAVNAAIATGMDWRELDALIREERRSGNPVAGLIHSLQLDQNKITLLLSNMLDDEDEDDEEALTRPATKVQVDLALSAYSNAAAHHSARKKQQAKQEKTLAAHAEALKAAEKKAQAQLNNLRNGPAATVLRKAAWYERFHWFISNENYLVISGHDAQQNELIVKRYFRKEDVYVHAELHGASSTIIRNHDPSRPVPPLTLQQAGCACVCRSKAWDAKLVTSAWWVYHHQVSKTAPTGEYLPTGSFMIRGKKNFLPPQGLVMGLAFMFKLEDSCIGRHAGERAVRGGLDDEDETEEQGGASSSKQQQQQRRLMQEEEDEEKEEDSQTGSTPASLSAAASSSTTSALDAFLDMSADQLAAAAAKARRPASGSGTAAAAGGGGGYERYGLEHPAVGGGGDDDEEEGVSAGTSGTQADSKRYISAAERACLKKASKSGSSTAQQQQQQQARQQQGGKGQGSQAAGAGGKPPAGPAAAAAAAAAAKAQRDKRGKKGKAAKAKERYAEQDEEDRELALQLLGSAGAKKTRQERRQARKSAKEEARTARDGRLGPEGSHEQRQDAIKLATASQFADITATSNRPAGRDDAAGGSSTGSDSGGEEGAAGREEQQPQADAPTAASASSNGTTLQAASAAGGAVGAVDQQQHQQQCAEADAESAAAAAAAAESSGDDADDDAEVLAAAADEAERAEISALLAEENVAELPYEDGDATAAALKELDSLTGCPQPDDVLMYAVPVCGPYAALAAYKHKVKLTPGTLKKGKAAKQALELLVRRPEVSQRERDLMRAVPDAEMVACMVGTVKISASGLQQMKAATKKAKKAAAQQG